MNIIAKNDTGTWIGTCNGKIGHFKFISVEEMGSKKSVASNGNNENSRNKDCNGSRLLTVASSTSSSHVPHVNATDSSFYNTHAGAAAGSQQVGLLYHSCGTDSGTKSETASITAISRGGSMRQREGVEDAGRIMIAGSGFGEKKIIQTIEQQATKEGRKKRERISEYIRMR